MYNAEKYLEEALESVEKQTYGNYEVIIINDGSTDKSEEIINKYVKNNDKFKLIKFEKNKGVSEARNAGIKEAKGMYLTFLDADDIWKPQKLESQIDFLKRKNCDFAYTAFKYIKGNKVSKKIEVSLEIDYKKSLSNMKILTTTTIINLSRIPKQLCYMPDTMNEDIVTWWNILKNGRKAYGQNEVLAYYRVTKNSRSSNKFRTAKYRWKLYRQYEKFSILKSSYYFINYIINASIKRIGKFKDIKETTINLPGYEVRKLREKENKYCICIPIINEGERLKNELQRVKDNHILEIADIVLIDSGTTDDSISEENLEKYRINTLIEMDEKRKYTQSKALQVGFYYAMENGYGGVISIDGNNKDSIEDVYEIVEKLENGYDYIQGSRYIDGGQAINTPKMREFAIKCIHTSIISNISQKKYTDTTNLFRGYSRRYLLHDEVQPFRTIFKSYELSIYLSVRADQLGLETCEVPVTRRYPEGKKFSTKVGVIKGNYLLLKSLFEAKIGRYNI